MTVTAVVGAQWGDEGKGRIIDYLAQEADVVIRFQGGDKPTTPSSTRMASTRCT